MSKQKRNEARRTLTTWSDVTERTRARAQDKAEDEEMDQWFAHLAGGAPEPSKDDDNE